MIIDFSELDYRLKAVVKKGKRDGTIDNADASTRLLGAGIVGLRSTAYGTPEVPAIVRAGIGAVVGALLGQGLVTLNNHILKRELLKHYRLGSINDKDINTYLNTGKVTSNLSKVIREIQSRTF